MSSMKQKICNKMRALYDHLLANYVNSFELAAVNEDIEGMAYWDGRIADCLAKREKYESKQE